MKTHTITTFAAIAAACFAGTSAHAGTQMHAAPPSKPVREIVPESCITGDVGFDVVSNYISKGIVWENQGFIIQPYADLHFRTYKGSGLVSSITTDIGIWNSFQSHKGGAGAGSTTSNWFEFDFTAGMTLAIDKFTISPQFRVYESPSDAFRNVYTAGITVAYDDSHLLGIFALHPYVFVELELVHTIGNGQRPGGAPGNANGQYYEIGITPAHSYGNSLTLSVPVKAGFGSGDFYQGNKGFGFISGGIDAAYALNFVPECLGKWTIHSGVTYYYLGNGSNAFAPATGGNINSSQWVFGGGLKVAF